MGFVRAVAYLVPGACWLALTALIWRAVPPGARTPRWARRHVVISTTLLAATGLAVTALGAYLVWAIS
jgi:hypothetical protein